MSFEESDRPPKQRTVMVFLLLSLAAGVFSYLGAFAVVGALASADVIERWPAHRDPRARWMATTFAALLVCFLLIAAVFRWTSNRQLKRLDAIGADGD